MTAQQSIRARRNARQDARYAPTKGKDASIRAAKNREKWAAEQARKQNKKGK